MQMLLLAVFCPMCHGPRVARRLSRCFGLAHAATLKFCLNPNGRYLDDLWVYTHYVAGDEPNWFEGYHGQAGTLEGQWTQLPRLDTCYSDPGETWAERNDITCVVNWPSGRAGAAMALRTEQSTGAQQLWLHGGFRTQFP